MTDQRGLIITTAGYTKDARTESDAAGKTPISLIDGKRLIQLLVEKQIGVRRKPISLARTQCRGAGGGGRRGGYRREERGAVAVARGPGALGRDALRIPRPHRRREADHRRDGRLGDGDLREGHEAHRRAVLPTRRAVFVGVDRLRRRASRAHQRRREPYRSRRRRRRSSPCSRAKSSVSRRSCHCLRPARRTRPPFASTWRRRLA